MLKVPYLEEQNFLRSTDWQDLGEEGRWIIL